MSDNIKGVLMISAAAFFWGISGTIARILFINDADPFIVVNMRLNLAFCLLFAIVVFRNRNIIKIKEYKDLGSFAILGLVGIFGMQTTYYYTISVLNVSMAIFLQFLSPIIVVVYCVLFQGEKMTRKKIISLTLAMCGSFLIVFGKQAGMVLLPIGVVTGILSAFCNAFYTIYSKKLTNRYRPSTIVLYAFGFAAVPYWFIGPPWQLWSQVTFNEFIFVLYLAVFATIVPFSLFINGVKFMKPTSAGILALLEPVAATSSAFLLIGESMTLKQMMGMICILGSLAILQAFGKENSESYLGYKGENCDSIYKR